MRVLVLPYTHLLEFFRVSTRRARSWCLYSAQFRPRSRVWTTVAVHSSDLVDDLTRLQYYLLLLVFITPVRLRSGRTHLGYTAYAAPIFCFRTSTSYWHRSYLPEPGVCSLLACACGARVSRRASAARVRGCFSYTRVLSRLYSHTPHIRSYGSHLSCFHTLRRTLFRRVHPLVKHMHTYYTRTARGFPVVFLLTSYISCCVVHTHLYCCLHLQCSLLSAFYTLHKHCLLHIAALFICTVLFTFFTVLSSYMCSAGYILLQGRLHLVVLFIFISVQFTHVAVPLTFIFCKCCIHLFAVLLVFVFFAVLLSHICMCCLHFLTVLCTSYCSVVYLCTALFTRLQCCLHFCLCCLLTCSVVTHFIAVLFYTYVLRIYTVQCCLHTRTVLFTLYCSASTHCCMCCHLVAVPFTLICSAHITCGSAVYTYLQFCFLISQCC